MEHRKHRLPRVEQGLAGGGLHGGADARQPFPKVFAPTFPQLVLAAPGLAAARIAAELRLPVLAGADLI